MDWKLHNYQQAHELISSLMPRIKARLNGGHVLTLSIKEEKRSIDQNAMFHSIIGQVAKQAQHMGAKWDTESWKRFLVDAWAAETDRRVGQVVPSLDGQRVVQLGIQTRNFTKEEASEFTEWLMAWCSSNGVEIDEIR